jgi:hypothetical protein
MRISERFSELSEVTPEQFHAAETGSATAADITVTADALRERVADYVTQAVAVATQNMNSGWQSDATNIARQQIRGRLKERSRMKYLVLQSLSKTTKLYMMQLRDAQKMESITDMLVGCMLATCFFTAMSPYVATPAGGLLVAVAALVLVFVLVRTVRSWSLRRHDDWNKIYFSKDIKPDSPAEDASTSTGPKTPPGTCGR